MDIDVDEIWRLRDLCVSSLQEEDEEVEVGYNPPHVPCKHANTRTDRKQGQVACADCGVVLDAILTDVFGNTIPLHCVKPHSLYRRKHHFNERLSQWLCLSRRVPDSVIHLVKQNWDHTTVLTKTVVRTTLRRLGLAKYIENWIEIHCHVVGRAYPVIDSEMIEKIRDLFIKIEIAFEKHRPPTRKCILSYNYVLARIFQIFNLHEHLMWVPPLKSRVKLKYLDSIWTNMVVSLGLPNIPPPDLQQIPQIKRFSFAFI